MSLLVEVTRLLAATRIEGMPTPALEPGDDSVVYVGALSIARIERVVEVRTIAGPRRAQRVEYDVEAVVGVPASQWSPPDADVVEVGTYQTLGAAVAALAGAIVSDRIDAAIECDVPGELADTMEAP